MPLTTGSGQDTSPEIADGRTLFYSNMKSGYQLARLDPTVEDGSGEEVLLERQRGLWLPQLSPTGDRLVFFHETQAGVQVFTLLAAGGTPTRITRDPESQAIHPSWSSDGQHVYYHRVTPPALMRVSANGGTPSVVVPISSLQQQMFTWLDPTGARLVSTSQGEGETFSSIRELATRARNASSRSASARSSVVPDRSRAARLPKQWRHRCVSRRRRRMSAADHGVSRRLVA